MALDVWLEARVVRGAGDPVYAGTLALLDPATDFLLRAIADRLPEDTHLEVYSDIPVSRGLGSSAAARVAGLVLRNLLSRSDIDRAELFEAARGLEGHPDNAGPAVFGGLVLSAARPHVLALHSTFGVALAVPEREISTETARAILPPRLSREEAIAQASRSAALVLGLTTGDGELVGYGMIDLIAAPYRAQLIAGFHDAVHAAKAAGAFGATVSGAGSGIVAISGKTDAPRVAEAMVSALSRKGNSAEALVPEVVAGGFRIGP